MLSFDVPGCFLFLFPKQDGTETSSPAGNVPSTALRAASLAVHCQHGMLTGPVNDIHYDIVSPDQIEIQLYHASWKRQLCLLVSMSIFGLISSKSVSAFQFYGKWRVMLCNIPHYSFTEYFVRSSGTWGMFWGWRFTMQTAGCPNSFRLGYPLRPW